MCLSSHDLLAQPFAMSIISTLRVSRARKRERSGRWRASAGRGGSVQGKTGTWCSPSCSTALAPLPLALQLLLELLEEAPIRALDDKLLGAGLEHPGLVQTQGVEAHRILGVILPPDVVGELLDDLQGSV